MIVSSLSLRNQHHHHPLAGYRSIWTGIVIVSSSCQRGVEIIGLIDPGSESSMLYPGLQIIISQNKNPVCFFPWVGVSPCGGLRWWQDSSLAYCQWHCRRRRSLTKTGQRARKQNCWLSAAEIPLVGGGRKQERLLFAKITIIFSGWDNVLLAHFAGSWKAASEEMERERPLSLSLSLPLSLSSFSFHFRFLFPLSLPH